MDKSPREINRMVKKAKHDDQKADKAERVVDEALTKSVPQRKYRESPNEE